MELVDTITEAYQIYPPGAPVVPQIYSEVRMGHKNEGKRVFLGGINANERYKTLVIVVEGAACPCFFVQPLPVVSRERNTVAG